LHVIFLLDNSLISSDASCLRNTFFTSPFNALIVAICSSDAGASPFLTSNVFTGSDTISLF